MTCSLLGAALTSNLRCVALVAELEAKVEQLDHPKILVQARTVRPMLGAFQALDVVARLRLTQEL